MIYLFMNFKSIIFSTMLYGPENSDHTSLNLSKQACPLLTRGSNLTTRKQRSGPLLNASLASIIRSM